MSEDRVPFSPGLPAPAVDTALAAVSGPATDVTILFHHFPDGTVGALAYGLTGIGRDIAEALRDLEDRVAARTNL